MVIVQAMVVIRNRLSLARAGGPRQYAELRDRLMMRVDSFENRENVMHELRRLDLSSESLDNAPVVIARPSNNFSEVISRVRDLGSDSVKLRQAEKEVDKAESEDRSILESTAATISATREYIQQVRLINNVDLVDFVRTEADFGPENLRQSPSSLPSLGFSESQNQGGTLDELNERLGVTEAWEQTRGENAIVAIFDTGFAEDIIDESRIRDTFHAGGTDSAYESSEGHGTMCAGAAAASKDEELPFNGIAPDAEVILVRITDSEGQISGDVISKAWDWIADLDHQKPIVVNHSYGTPLCSGRPRGKFCDTVLNDVVKRVNANEDIVSVYAAGNEAMRCGHRPSGVTNAITGTNSLAEVITVGALLTDGREAQRYSSHGRGDCAPISDPKPNVSCAIPERMYYGGDNGYEIKDMSTGPYGSAGGTSHAAPMVTGMIALIQSKAVADDNRDKALHTEEIKQIIHENSNPPRPTQINRLGMILGTSGFDARFGHGQLDINAALEEV
jgi:subtilisin family serine protease